MISRRGLPPSATRRSGILTLTGCWRLLTVTDEVEPPVFDRECTDGETDTSSVIRLAGDAGCRLPLKRKAKCRIAVARDEAFCFLYADNLDALRGAGAELVFFSPLHDAALPDADGLYLPGGYPELHAAALSKNTAMRESIAQAVGRGLPTVAECGGFLYLQQSLEDAEGHSFPQCGALPGRGFKTERLQRFGYLTLRAPSDSLLFRAGGAGSRRMSSTTGTARKTGRTCAPRRPTGGAGAAAM